MSSTLTALVDKIEQLGGARLAFLGQVQRLRGQKGETLDLSLRVASIGKSLAEIDTRVVVLCGLARSIDRSADAVLVPQRVLEDVDQRIERIAAQYQTTFEQLVRVSPEDEIRGVLDPAALTFLSSDGQVNVQLGSVFEQIWQTAENLLEPFHTLMATLGTPGQADFSAAANGLSRVVEAMYSQHDALAKLIKRTSADHEKLNDVLERATAAESEIERLKGESDKGRRSLAEYESEGTQKITSIRAIGVEADALKKQVKTYQGAFDIFQEKLESREESIAKGRHEQDLLLADVKKIKQHLAEINQQAESMLSGATVAGLASAYGNMRNELSQELRVARRAFYASIAVLLVSVLPLAIYMIPGLGEVLPQEIATASSETRVGELLLQILGRTILLIPAAWLTRFAASRHAALFRLKEHYAYKYSVASSVEGFKKQAEPYRDEIAAATFFELTDNPAVRMEAETHEERTPNPAMDWIMTKVGATHDGKKRA